MKTHFYSFVIIIIFLQSYSISYSQSGWILQQSQTTRNLNDLFFINSMTGWCTGDSNTILKTTNGGTNWYIQMSSGYNKLSSVFFSDENTGWCCGGITYPLKSGVIYKTTNSGINWFMIYGLGGSSFNKLYFIDSNTGFRTDDSSPMYGSSGSVSKTTNGGMNWYALLGGEYEFTAVKFKDPSTGWAAGYYWSDVLGDSSLVFKTTNGGVNWQIKFKERGGILKDISYYDNSVWIAGKDSSILYSSDSGDNWIKQNTNNTRRFNSVFFINENTGWAAGYRYPDTTNLIKTTNGGADWFNLKNNHGIFLNSVIFINEYTGWTSGNTGLILKTTSGGLTGLNNNADQNPVAFQLYQNYPNPFNPVTVIRYSLSENSFTTLKVSDALGREIVTLVNETQNTGTYESDFDAGSLSSGIYFYSLFVNHVLMDSKKMLLVR